MNILQVVDTTGIGGAEKLVVTFAREACQRNIPVTVACLKSVSGPSIEPEIRALGVPVRFFVAPRLLAPGRFVKFWDFLRRGDFDIVHTHLLYANVLGCVAARWSRIPAIATLHSISQEPRHYHPLRDAFETAALRFAASNVLAVGYEVADTHQKRIPGKPIVVIPNGVERAAPLSPEQRLALRRDMVGGGDPARTLCLSVGRLMPAKGFSDLLTAFQKVVQSAPVACLAIAGSGGLAEELQNQIVNLGLSAHVRMLGARNDIPQLMAASDLFTLASHWEGLPLTILEAMMAGLPIAATAVGDIPRVVMPDAGILVAPQSPDELAQALLALIEHPERRRQMGAQGRAFAEKHYHVSAWFDKLLALYQDTITGERSRDAGSRHSHTQSHPNSQDPP